MKKSMLIILVFFAVIVLPSFRNGKKISQNAQGAKERKGFAVVELFTSEGCSSCPSADELVTQISKENTKDVYILGYHVDYWDRLGWKDIYSDPNYTNRQHAYASTFGLTSVYTPQIVVNGRVEFTGSDEKRLRQSIESGVSGDASIPIRATANFSGGKIKVEYAVTNTSGDLLQIALVQSHAESAVKSGENTGRHLLHINVVREFKTISMDDSQSGSIVLHLPVGLSAKDCRVIAFLQKKNLHIEGCIEMAVGNN